MFVQSRAGAPRTPGTELAASLDTGMHVLFLHDSLRFCTVLPTPTRGAEAGPAANPSSFVDYAPIKP